MKKYFYIIHRDGQIFEIEFTEERFKSSFDQWQRGGLIVFPSLGMGLNSVDITKILNEEQYEGFVDSSQPKIYIKNGTWYSNKDKSIVRYEEWKEKEIEEKNKLYTPEYYAIEKPKEINYDEVYKMIKKNRPNFKLYK